MLRKILLAVNAIAAIAVCAGCAPRFETVIPPVPTLPASNETPASASSSCPAIAPLKPAPKLPEAEASACPAGSHLAKCFDAANANAAAEDFDLLVKDRDYCRDEYGRLVGRGQ
jgi:hypothetical protein